MEDSCYTLPECWSNCIFVCRYHRIRRRSCLCRRRNQKQRKADGVHPMTLRRNCHRCVANSVTDANSDRESDVKQRSRAEACAMTPPPTRRLSSVGGRLAFAQVANPASVIDRREPPLDVYCARHVHHLPNPTYRLACFKLSPRSYLLKHGVLRHPGTINRYTFAHKKTYGYFSFEIFLPCVEQP